jgi:hypothetical protein
MKNIWSLIRLYGIFSLIIFSFSCKKEEVSPNEKFVGIYDYNGNTMPDDNGNFPKGEGIVAVISPTKVIIYEQKLQSPERKWEFPECEITDIDSAGTYYKHYAKIVDKRNGMLIGKIRNRSYYSNGSVYLRVWIDMVFTDDKNEKITLYAIKRKD